MDHRPGTAADATSVARADRRICWGWTFAGAGADRDFGYVAPCAWDVDPTDWLAHLVGRIALFIESEEFAFALSRRWPANDLRRRFAFLLGAVPGQEHQFNLAKLVPIINRGF